MIEASKYDNPCSGCSWFDLDMGCTCDSIEMWYQCPLEPEPDWDSIYPELKSTADD